MGIYSVVILLNIRHRESNEVVSFEVFYCVFVYREEAFKVAVSQARSKAQSVSQCLGVNLGSVLSLVEDKLEEKCMDQDKESVDVVERDSISYMASISVVFEVIPIKNNIRKK